MLRILVPHVPRATPSHKNLTRFALLQYRTEKKSQILPNVI